MDFTIRMHLNTATCVLSAGLGENYLTGTCVSLQLPDFPCHSSVALIQWDQTPSRAFPAISHPVNQNKLEFYPERRHLQRRNPYSHVLSRLDLITQDLVPLELLK